MIETAINYIAIEMAKICKEEGFESFNEMKECYWWTTSDIKEEFQAYMNDLGNVCIDEVDGTQVVPDSGEMMSYREFSAKVRKAIDKLLVA